MADLNYLLRPRSIAIVGVTDKPGTYGLRSATNIVNSAIGEHVYYVNPKRDELLGRKCYHSISEIPEAIDCAVLCVPKKAVCSCIEEAGACGVKAAVVFASGFSEEQSPEGRALESELAAIAKKYRMISRRASSEPHSNLEGCEDAKNEQQRKKRRYFPQ